MRMTSTKLEQTPAPSPGPAVDQREKPLAATASADRSGPAPAGVGPMSTELLAAFVAEERGSAGELAYMGNSVEDLINRDPTGFAEDSVVKAWGEKARGPLSAAAEQASLLAIESGTAEDHTRAYRYHVGACSAHRAANDEARANPGCFRAEWKHHFEKGMAHQDLAFALQRGMPVDPRFQHYLQPQGRMENADVQFIRGAMAIRDRQEGPRIGDFVRFPDGAIHRLAREREGGEGSFQTAEPDHGAFYLGGPDTLFFSCGSLSLGPFVNAKGLRLMDEAREGEVWTFHNQDASPGNRVNALVPFRVFEVTSDAGGGLKPGPVGSRIPQLLANHAEDIRAALIAYRFGDQVNYNATVDKVLRESGAELWEYIEASSTIQEETGLTLEVVPDPPGWNPSTFPAPSPNPDPDDEAFDRFVADREGRLLD